MESELESIEKTLGQLVDSMANSVRQKADVWEKIHPSQIQSGKNLVHYLTLRSQDIRALQEKLHMGGLSSLTHAESHIMGQLVAILKRLGTKDIPTNDYLDYSASKLREKESLEALFGKKESQAPAYVMVTLDGKWANDPSKIESLIAAGMHIARINCAHDSEEIWKQLIDHTKGLALKMGTTCLIYMDLAGPKIRTRLISHEPLKVAVDKSIYLTDELHQNQTPKPSKTLGCSIPNIFNQVQKGQVVLFDDGLIQAVVEELGAHWAKLKIERISSKKPYIKHEKGINFPQTALEVDALTSFDTSCLPFIDQNADLVGYSFVKTAGDLQRLREAWGGKLKKKVILKIETPQAVENLPELVLEGMKEASFGVMIARGDLAVEIGFERLSEIQEEILWICHAAHVPVIWATQVLENMNKTGMATRSEVTDAYHAIQADAVMLNKGNFVLETLNLLKDILQRSGSHRDKRRYAFRPLGIAKGFLDKAQAPISSETT